MSQPRDDRQDDLFRPALEEIINLRHPLVRLAAEIDWGFLAGRFGSVCRAGPGQPPLPTRLVAGLFILKHMHNLSDEMLCDRWVENPYFQYFCGEVVFRHEAPFDRSSLTRWRQRLGEEQIAALLQESLSVAHRRGAIESKDLERVVVDTTVEERRLRIRPMRGSPTGRSRSSSRWPNARASSYARVICAWPNARPLWWGAIRMPTSSSALGGNSNSCARDLAASSATFAARSRPMPHGRIAFVRCSILHCGFAIRAAPTRTKGLLMARPRGGVHRPRQGTDAVRVRLQGVDCHASHRAQRRTVRAACQGAAWQSVRRPHARSRHR